MTRLAIFIDGSNFHGALGRLTQVHHETRRIKPEEYYQIDFKKLIKFLSELASDIKLVKVYYVRSETDADYERRKEFYSRLDYFGYKVDIKRRLAGRREKGVDMAIAMEMLILAHNNTYDEAVLIAQDGDYCQLVREIQRLGKRVGLAVFSLDDAGLNATLAHEVDSIVDLTKGDLLIKLRSERKDAVSKGTV